MATSRPENRKSASPPAAPTAQPLAPALLERASAAAARRGATCEGRRQDGGACGMSATLASGSKWCIRHSPDISDDQRLAWVTRGGYVATGSRSAVLAPETPDPDLSSPEAIADVIKTTAGQLRRGELAPSIAVALTGLLNTSLRAYEANVARRLLDLEKLAADRARRVPAVRLER
jgi:hypothetical protein